jgi:hypothetical protein
MTKCEARRVNWESQQGQSKVEELKLRLEARLRNPL